MQATDIRVCNMALLDNDIQHFGLSELGKLLETFPAIEYPHQYEHYTLIYVENAEGEIIVDNVSIRLNKAQVIFIRPNCITSIHLNSEAKGKVICFTEAFFSVRYNNNVLHQFNFLQRGTRPYVRLNALQHEQWIVFMNLISNEYALHKKEYIKVLRSYLNIILFELERLYSPIGFIKPQSNRLEKVQQFEQLIDQYFIHKKLTSNYAELLHVSANYLNKICKEETGQTAGELIRNRITIEAQRLLHYTCLSVKEIADKLGFENVSYFITYFKKQIGLSPEQFRRKEY